MKATAHLKKLIENIFESKKFFELELTAATDAFDNEDEDSDDYEALEKDVDSINEICDDLDDLLLKIKESYDLEETE